MQARRFYNASLKANVYDKCLVATRNRYEALSTLEEEEYDCEEHREGPWKQTTFVPTCLVWDQPFHLSEAFRSFDPGGKKADTSNKQAKKSAAARAHVQNNAMNDDDEPKRKRPAAFSRLTEMEGQMRVYKVLMLPTQ